MTDKGLSMNPAELKKFTTAAASHVHALHEQGVQLSVPTGAFGDLDEAHQLADALRAKARTVHNRLLDASEALSSLLAAAHMAAEMAEASDGSTHAQMHRISSALSAADTALAGHAHREKAR